MMRLSSEAVLLTPRVSAVGEEGFCPGDHVSADWFHRLFNGMEWSAQRELADCVVCTAMTIENSIEIPCCRQFVNVICLAQFFFFTWVDCLFCNHSLADFARSSSFMASSLFHGCMVDL